MVKLRSSHDRIQHRRSSPSPRDQRCVVRWLTHGRRGAQPGRQEGDTDKERSQIADAGWTKWGPVQGAAIGLHLLSGLAIVADNRRRTLTHPPTTAAVVLKTTLTGAALAASGAAYLYGARLGEAREKASENPVARMQAAKLSERMRWLQWATPADHGRSARPRRLPRRAAARCRWPARPPDVRCCGARERPLRVRVRPGLPVARAPLRHPAAHGARDRHRR